jgi:DNA primase small subunit
MLERAYQHLEPIFVRDVIPNHKLFATAEQWNALLESLPEAAQPVKDHLREEWTRAKKGPTSPEHKWSTLKKHLNAFIKNSKPAGSVKHAKTLASKDLAKLEAFCPTLVFTYTYPRLDVNVSKMRNHLLKSPFCVHPKTGRVCVPFLASEVDEFDPFQVPTLPQLLREVDAYDKAAAARNTGDENENENVNQGVQHDWQKTSLEPYFGKFQRTFLEPMLRDIRTRTMKRDRDSKEKQAAALGDF